jgi:glycosyltransferase involved in cell wall biosynthesis
MTRISVVIPCHNSAPWLLETLASVVNQTLPALEIVLVDDGSTDDTAAIIDDAVAKHPSVMRAALDNRGVAAARNLGISMASGEYIMPLDADDLIAPTMLAECARVLDVDPDTTVVFTDREDFGALEGVFAAGAFDVQHLKYFNQLSHCALYRRTLWHSIGGYRTNVTGFDDWDFWLAAALRGARGHHLAQPLFRHRRHRGSQLGRIFSDYERLHATIICNNRDAYRADEVADAERFLTTGVTCSLLQASRRLFTLHYPLPR